jgi:putative transmembrane protein PGPGW
MDAAANKNIFQKLNHALRLDQLPRNTRRIIVGVVGGTVLLIGVALVFLPGPAFVVIPLGLAILASEFAWVRRWLNKARSVLKRKGKRTSQ